MTSFSVIYALFYDACQHLSQLEEERDHTATKKQKQELHFFCGEIPSNGAFDEILRVGSCGRPSVQGSAARQNTIVET